MGFAKFRLAKIREIKRNFVPHLKKIELRQKVEDKILIKIY